MGNCCLSADADDSNDPLLAEIPRDQEARRKAAEAALRRVGAMTSNLRPKPKAVAPRPGSSVYGDGMQWKAG